MRSMGLTSVTTLGLLFCLATAVPAQEPSVKEGVEEVGEAVKQDTEKAVDTTKDAVEHGARAAGSDVGKAMQKTGETIDKGGEKVREKTDE
jgi:hypothetical protein